jgi:hypothetical protein
MANVAALAPAALSESNGNFLTRPELGAAIVPAAWTPTQAESEPLIRSWHAPATGAYKNQ